jgi:hypothetical protein
MVFDIVVVLVTLGIVLTIGVVSGDAERTAGQSDRHWAEHRSGMSLLGPYLKRHFHLRAH